MTAVSIRTRITIALAVTAALLSAAHAGPPFLTDDPYSADCQHLEIYPNSLGIGSINSAGPRISRDTADTGGEHHLAALLNKRMTST